MSRASCDVRWSVCIPVCICHSPVKGFGNEGPSSTRCAQRHEELPWFSPAANGRDLHSWTQRGLPWQGSPSSTALRLPVPLFRTLKRHLSSNNKGKRILQKLFFSFLFVLMCDCWLQNSAINQGTIFFLLQVCQATVFPFQLTFQLKAKFSCL